jgi:hypothetical protein
LGSYYALLKNSERHDCTEDQITFEKRTQPSVWVASLPIGSSHTFNEQSPHLYPVTTVPMLR